MSTLQSGISAVEVTYNEAAQARIAELRAMRDAIPHLTVPARKGDTRRLGRAASLSPQFVELTVVATKNSTALVRGDYDPDQVRDLNSFADAFGPFADELDALAGFVRHSVTTARNTAGTEALITFEVAKRLARRPKTADLMPFVEAMGRALGVQGRKAKPPAVTAPSPAAVPSK
jgi:hypothetical protein